MNIYALTAPGSNYPAFVSMNLTEKNEVELIVRESVRPDGRCGNQVSVTMSVRELQDMATKLYSFATTRAA